MRMKDFKVYPGLIASDFYIMEGDGHSLRIWLWETQEGLKRWAENYSTGLTGDSDEYDGCEGLHSPSDWLIFNTKDHYAPFQHIGELHFIKDRWDLNIVTHEFLHALFHYIRVIVPDFGRSFYMNWMSEEEKICYPFGEWCDWAYRWLWKKNPNPKWEKEVSNGN